MQDEVHGHIQAFGADFNRSRTNAYEVAKRKPFWVCHPLEGMSPDVSEGKYGEFGTPFSCSFSLMYLGTGDKGGAGKNRE